MTECRMCKGHSLREIYNLRAIPFFQNKVYPDFNSAITAPAGDVVLARCAVCGFVFNKEFDPANMIYDESYQNEQNYSTAFDGYLEDILGIIKSTFKKIDPNKKKEDFKVMEIGCGKGYFLEKMRDFGLSAFGIDPAYEGHKDYIIKDYFSEKYADFNSDLIVLRHTIEHVPEPFEFIRNIAKANNYCGWIFIETPDFEWIIRNSAFWDIYYEHCNYFTPQALCSLFEECFHGLIFNGQYQYVAADLSKVRACPGKVNQDKGNSKSVSADDETYLIFESTLEKYSQILDNQDFEKAVWGMGAKGVAFLNTLDPAREKVQYVIDINPKKQGNFNAGSGHHIISPERFINEISGTKRKVLVLVMNSNYLDEIKQRLSQTTCEITSL